jgi:lysozyme
MDTFLENYAALKNTAELLSFKCYIRTGKVPQEVRCILQELQQFAEEMKYDPNQPRVPAGSSDGGQWTSGGEGTSVRPSTPTKTPQEVYHSAKKLSVSQNLISFIANEEKFRPQVYLDQAGRPTIGYGHLLKRNEKFPKGITEKQAREILKQDYKIAEKVVQSKVTVPLTQYQFDALTTLIFNIGEGNFGNSTLLRVLNRGKYQDAADQFLVWNKVIKTDASNRVVRDREGRNVYVVSRGLNKRREKERRLFLMGQYE